MWYAVIVADQGYHKDEALTYASSQQIDVGRLVVVPLRSKEVLGIVTKEVAQPAFVAKEVLQIPPLPALPATSLALLEWIRNYYPAPLGVTAQLFLPKKLSKKAVVQNAKLAEPDTVALPPLTDDQKSALAAIAADGLHLLHGETGSGKTRVYIELARQALTAGKSSLLITPEIALTPQLANEFRAVFGERVVVVHSGISDASRQRTWQLLLEAREPMIIVGARSALFCPVRNLGVVIVDEAHETAYKQDQAPYYHASSVAAKLAKLHQAPLILGSATPLVSDYFIASAKQRPIIRMTQVASNKNQQASTIEIVDLKDRNNFVKSPYLSDRLVAAIQRTLGKHEQVLLFLNRRGTARVVFCERCGWQASCPHCDLPLVYHGDRHLMRCHSCNFQASAPSACPDCKNTTIVFKSIGTKAVFNEVERLFPEASVMRFDADNKKNERLDTHYATVRSGNVDVIIGTQTLAKGLDLPKLGLVGVIIADTSLYFPDFSAQERTYQLLAQVIGRVSRGHRDGAAIIQTYAPESPLLAAIRAKDWDIFYNKELAERQQFQFPPFCFLLKLTCKRASSQSAQKNAEQLAHALKQKYPQVSVEGPAPSFHERLDNKYAWQIIVKAKRRPILTDIIRSLPSGWSYDIDPMNLL